LNELAKSGNVGLKENVSLVPKNHLGEYIQKYDTTLTMTAANVQ
jgi:hypothetical protein